jgi:hypothetical protein
MNLTVPRRRVSQVPLFNPAHPLSADNKQRTVPSRLSGTVESWRGARPRRPRDPQADAFRPAPTCRLRSGESAAFLALSHTHSRTRTHAHTRALPCQQPPSGAPVESECTLPSAVEPRGGCRRDRRLVPRGRVPSSSGSRGTSQFCARASSASGAAPD